MRHAGFGTYTVVGRTIRALARTFHVALKVVNLAHGRVGLDEHRVDVVGRGVRVIGAGNDGALTTTRHGKRLAANGQDGEAASHTGGVRLKVGFQVFQISREGHAFLKGNGGVLKVDSQVVHGAGSC